MVAISTSSATRSADIIRMWCFSLSCHSSWNNLVSIRSDPHFRIIRDKEEECKLCDANHIILPFIFECEKFQCGLSYSVTSGSG